MATSIQPILGGSSLRFKKLFGEEGNKDRLIGDFIKLTFQKV